MRKVAYPRQWLWLSLFLGVALLAAQCGPSAPAGPTPTATSVSEATSQPPEEEPVSEEAAKEETPDDGQEVITEIVEESEAAQVRGLETGVTVVGDEDVSTPRTRLGGEYRDVGTSDAVSFHPYLVSDGTSLAYQGMVYTGGLLRLDENTLEYVPNMAEAYTISEDGLTFTFHLRQDMKWSDGRPISAQDFKWTYDQAVDPNNEFPYLSQIQFITSYEALDDYTLEVKIDQIYAPALGQMSGMITPLPKHIWENLDWSDPETNPEINSPSVVSGPYKLVEWKRDQFTILEANPNYWYHGPPNIERYTIEIVPDEDIAYQKMKSGETDTGPITVRHGLNYAIDKRLLTEEVMVGQANRLCSSYPETSWVYNPDVPCYEFDPDKAIAEFEEAGYTFQDGRMLDENGEQLTLTLLYGPNTNQTRELIAVTVQDYLADIGVEVEIQAVEWSTYLEAVQAEEPDWDMTIGTWSSTIDPHIMYTIWAEENIPNLNFVGYVNKEMEALFEEAGATYDTEFRKGKYQEIQRILADEAPYIFLFYNKTWSGQNNRVQGIDPRPLGISWNLEDWYIVEETSE
jgi:peptide/nickel transport system substrate-binding protein